MDFAAPLLGAALVVATATAATTISMAVRTRRAGQPRAGGWCLVRWSRYTAATGGAASILVSLPAIGGRLEAATGVDNLGMLLAHLFGILAIVGVRALLVTWTFPPNAWLRAVRIRCGAALAVAAAITVFALTTPSGVDLTNEYSHADRAASYLLVSDGYWAVTGAAIAGDCVPLAIDNARAGHRSIAAAQALIAAGGVASALWGATEGAFVAVTQIKGEAWNVSVQDTVSSTCAGLFALFLFSGITACSIRPARARR